MTLFIIIRLIYEAYFRFPHFRIMKACMQKWMHSKSGEFVTYQIEIKTKKNSSELTFEDLWIDEKKYKFMLSREDRKVANFFMPKDKLNLSVLSEIKNETINFPAKSSKGILLLSYLYRNKRKYISIKKFREFDNLHLSIH